MSGTMERRRHSRDIVLDRGDGGDIHVSLPRQVRHYGVDDFDWGYIGPAPAELALNILTWLLPPGVDGEPEVPCEEGECSAIAWRLHRSFMADFLARVPYAGACLLESDMRRWVLQHCRNPDDTAPPRSIEGWLSSFLRG